MKRNEIVFIGVAITLSMFTGCSGESSTTVESSQETSIDVTTEVITEVKALDVSEMIIEPTQIPSRVDEAIRFWADHFGELIYSDYEMDPDCGDLHEVSLVDYDGDSIPELITRYYSNDGDIWRYYDLNSQMTDYSESTIFDDTGILLFDPYYKVSMFEDSNGERTFAFNRYKSSEVDILKYKEERGYLKVKFDEDISLENIKYYTGVEEETGDQQWSLSDARYYSYDGSEVDEKTYNAIYVGDVIYPDEDYKVYDVYIDYENIWGSDQYKTNYVYSVLLCIYDKFSINEINNIDVNRDLGGTWNIKSDSSGYEWAFDKRLTTIVFEDDMVKIGDENQADYFIDYESYSGDLISWCVKTRGIYGEGDITFKINSYNGLLSVWMVVSDDGGELRYVDLTFEKK